VRRSRLLQWVGATVAVAALLAPVASGGGTARPSLRLVSDSPTTLRGAGFRPSERVTLVVVSNTKVRRRLAAGRGGGFVVRLPTVDANACEGLMATAIGSRGSKASYRRVRGMCPPPAPPAPPG
jgi:hypothetical protein